jgi:hypothetical protein
MLDRAEARHPDVAAFLDGLDALDIPLDLPPKSRTSVRVTYHDAGRAAPRISAEAEAVADELAAEGRRRLERRAPPEPTAADVERVAWWLYSVFSGGPDWLDDWENWLLDEDRADWRNVARAAIGAGLDPRYVP